MSSSFMRHTPEMTIALYSKVISSLTIEGYRIENKLE